MFRLTKSFRTFVQTSFADQEAEERGFPEGRSRAEYVQSPPLI